VLLLRENNFIVIIRLFIVSVFALTFFTATGCKKDNPVEAKPADTTKDTTLIYFTIKQAGLKNLRQGEHYVLWLKTKSDTQWKLFSTVDTVYNGFDSSVAVGKIASDLRIDSIVGALLTIAQPGVLPNTNYPILESHHFSLDSAHKVAISAFDSKNLLGNYSSLEGSLVFTSTLPDTLAYTHEFYLMNFTDSTKSASLLSLNAPPNGWEYGLWAEDLSFTPHQYFFYGLFLNPKGHDSDSLNDHYLFPGGWKPQQMNYGSGSIIVTLEPLFYGDSLKYKGPSPFTLLQFNRIRFIEKNKNYPMDNVSDGLPSGTIMFKRY
jgi:hypothetical protein